VAGSALAMMGLIALGPAAAADVNISPAQAVQGGEAELTFQVSNDRPGVWTNKVEVKFPDATPIGEIYPMSVAGWAPVATSRELDTPVDGVHNSGLTTVTSALTWIRADDAAKPPAVENLKVQLGPLPTTSEMVLTVIQTYSDGKTQTWSGPTATGTGTVLKLQPAAAAAPAPAATDAATVATTPEEGGTGTEIGLIIAGIIAGMLISALAAVTIGSKSRSNRAKDSADQKEDVVA